MTSFVWFSDKLWHSPLSPRGVGDLLDKATESVDEVKEIGSERATAQHVANAKRGKKGLQPCGIGYGLPILSNTPFVSNFYENWHLSIKPKADAQSQDDTLNESAELQEDDQCSRHSITTFPT